MAKVLILDQSKSIRNTLRERLEFEGIAAESAENEAAASVLCERIPFDLIISDHETRLPESDVPFIVLSSEATVDSAIKALRNGAQDYLTKPIDMNRLMQSIRQTLEQAAEAPRTAAKAKAKRSSAGHTEEIIGTSEQMQHVRRLIDKVAPCDARVLITGENLSLIHIDVYKRQAMTIPSPDKPSGLPLPHRPRSMFLRYSSAR